MRASFHLVSDVRGDMVPAVLCCLCCLAVLAISGCSKSEALPASANSAGGSTSGSPGAPVKDAGQLAGAWFHVGKSQQFFGEDIVGIEFLRGGKMLVTGAGGDSATWDYAFQDDGRISVTMGPTDIWNCTLIGQTLTVRPASEAGEEYQYRRLSGQSIAEAYKAESKAGTAADSGGRVALPAKAVMGAPISVGDLVETGINGQKVIGEVTRVMANTADLNLGQNNRATYLDTQYMTVIQQAGRGGPAKFAVGDVVQVPYLAGTTMTGRVIKVNGDYCQIDSSGSGFTGWAKAAELRLVRRGGAGAANVR